MTEPTSGWWSDVDNEVAGPWNWQPVLTYDGGQLQSLEVWFRSKEECDQFIRDHVAGRPLRKDS